MIFITGITGHSGSWFLKALIREGGIPGEKIRCLVRPESDTALLDGANIGIEKVVGNLNDSEFLKTAMKPDEGDTLSVLHIAGIGKSENVVKAALAYDVRRLILVHTTGIYSKYKKASQDYLSIEENITSIIKGRNINLNILRPTMIYGSIQDHNIIFFIKMAHRLKLFPIINRGQNSLQPVHARDLGEAYYHVLVHEAAVRNKNYDLSGKSPIKMIEMFQIISDKLGSGNRFISVPFWIAYLGAWTVYLLTLGKADFRERVQRMVEDRCYSHEDASRDFGYDPVSFADGVTDEIKEFIEQRQQ